MYKDQNCTRIIRACQYLYSIPPIIRSVDEKNSKEQKKNTISPEQLSLHTAVVIYTAVP